MLEGRDTVVALATPAGRAALAVVRASGPGVVALREAICVPHGIAPWQPGRVRRVDLCDARGVFDDAMAVFARGPRSFTGEDTLEITLHGNPLLVERLLAAAVSAGAKLAGPGEFSRQAVLNGKLDLVRAEGVDLAIRATSASGLALARAAPALGEVLAALRLRVLSGAAELEARLDYPGDELALTSDEALSLELLALAEEASVLADSYDVGRILVEGARVALVGPVNAGKSSLFNRLVGRERALVHDQAGTTRDVVESTVTLGPIAVTLLDTAGLRDTDDPVEAAGLALARTMIADADLWLVVLRGGPALSREEEDLLAQAAHRPHLVVYNGDDRPGSRPCPDGAISTSALKNTGVDALRSAIVARLAHTEAPPDRIVGSLRQATLLRELSAAVRGVVEDLDVAGVAVAAEGLTLAIEAVDALTGADTREDVLDALFSRFCIGK